MASNEALIKAFELLREMFPMWKITERTERLWQSALVNLSDKELELGVGMFAATAQHKTNMREPWPGDIAAAAALCTSIKWDEAFNECVRNAPEMLYPEKVMGRPKPVVFSSPVIFELLQTTGGAQHYAGITQNNLGTAKAQFRQAFQNKLDKLGGVIKKEPYLWVQELDHLDPKQLYIGAVHFADRIADEYRHVFSEGEIDQIREKAALSYVQNKAHKMNQAQIPVIDESQRARPALSHESQEKAKTLAESMIEKYGNAPGAGFLPAIIRKITGKKVLGNG